MRLQILVLCVLVASCGGRVAHPVSLEKDYDDRLSCAHLAGEYENNTKRLEELTGESREKFSNNLGLLISSPLFLDFSDTIKQETQAIVARNLRLQALMEEKGCEAPGATPDGGEEGASLPPQQAQ